LQQRQAKLKAPAGMTDFVGCGQHIPFDSSLRKPFVKGSDGRLDGPPRNADRRVEILFFEPGDEVKLVCHPQPDQCQPAACPIYLDVPFKFAPIGIPKGLKIAEVNLRLVFLDPEGKARPFPEGLPVLAKFGEVEDPPGAEEPERVGDGPGASAGGPASKAPILDDEPEPAGDAAPIIDLDDDTDESKEKGEVADGGEPPTATVGANGLV